MYVITFLFTGVLCGSLANFFTRNRGLGLLMDLTIGVIGGFFGGFYFDVFGIGNVGFWAPLGASTLGSISFLSIVGVLFATNRFIHQSAS